MADPIRDVLDCALCFKLLHRPVALHCGHTFCAACLQRALSTNPACPLCRQPCFLTVADARPNLIISRIMEARFADEVSERAREAVEEAVELQSLHLGLFLLDTGTEYAFPGVRTPSDERTRGKGTSAPPPPSPLLLSPAPQAAP